MLVASWRTFSVLLLLPLALALALLTAADVGPADGPSGSQPATLAAAAAPAPRTIRVLLSSGQRELSIGAEAPIAVLAPDGSRLGEAKPPLKLTISGGEVRAAGFKSASLILQPAKGFLSFGGNRYRGGFRTQCGSDGGLLLINLVDIEDYLRGVVPAEMPALWHPEAVKAQAVAARTYVLQRARANAARAYDVVGTVGDQVYGGVGREHPAADAAIKATHRRKVIFLKQRIGDQVGPSFLVFDRLYPQDEASHEYEILWHLDTGMPAVRGTALFSQDDGAANVAIIPADVTDLELSIVSGQEEPEWQGWRSIKNHQQGEYEPIPTAIYRWQVTTAARLVTLIVPLRPGESSPVARVEASADPGEMTVILHLADGGTQAIDEADYLRG